MRAKNRIAVDSALLFARMYPGKRTVIMTLNEATAKEARERLATQNGGARPFNVKVRPLL
jgi:hypothetical protein